MQNCYVFAVSDLAKEECVEELKMKAKVQIIPLALNYWN